MDSIQDDDGKTLDGKAEPIKKVTLEDLSREDLIKKCKAALLIAQKAKQTKSEYQSLNEKLTAEVEKATIQHKADKDGIRTLQELVESLTEQKLNCITEVDASKNKILQLQQKCKDQEHNIQTLKADIIVKDSVSSDLKLKISDLDSQCTSYKRQMERLQDENEQLINQLGDLEAKAEEMNRLGLQQRQQLSLLEETVIKGKNQDDVAIETNIESLKEKIDEFQKESFKSQETANEVEKKIRDINELYEIEKVKNEKCNSRLRSYKEKIIKCSTCITQLKNSRYILLKTIKDYSESIPKWQSEMLNISKLLTQKYSDEIKQLNETNESLKINFENKIDELEKCKNDNEKLVVKVNELKKKIGSYGQESEKNDQYELLKLQIKALESEKLTIIQEKQQARDRLAEVETSKDSYVSEINSLRRAIEETKNMRESLQEENMSLKAELENIKKILENSPTPEEWEKSKERTIDLNKQNDTLHVLNGLLKEEIDTLKSALETPSDYSGDLNESLQADILRLENKLSAYKQENTTLLQELKEYRPKLKELNNLKDEIEVANSKLQSYKTENSELLKEMKEINEVLKERGECISKQQKTISEMEAVLEKHEIDLRNSNAKNEELEMKVDFMQKHIDIMKKEVDNYIRKLEEMTTERNELVKKMDENKETIRHLRDEIEKIKLTSTDASTNDETMSTSTISRVEENARMKDLDESFEEKYSKLRIFAVKLKRRVAELQSQLATEKEKNKVNSTELSQTEVEQVDESSYGKHQVQLNEGANIKSNEITLLEKQLEKKDEEINALKNQLSTVKDEAKTIDVVDAACDVKEISQLKERLDILKNELESEKKCHSNTKEELSQAKRNMKKKSVLSLEMEDYERSMKELTLKMEDNKKKIVQMESTIETQQGTINSLKSQVKLLEDQVKSEENQHRLTKEELHRTLEDIEEKDKIVQTKNDAINKIEGELEALKQRQEEVNLQMTSMLGEKEKMINSLFQDKIELGQKLKKNEATTTDLEDKLRAVNIELEDLKSEFTSYKVRAQAVLRQNQTIDHSIEESLKEDNSSLKVEVDTLKSQIQSKNIESDELRAVIKEERRKNSENSSALSRANQRCRRFEADVLKLTDELDAAKKQHSLQVATLTQCYKTQITDLENKLSKETENLKQQLETIKELNQRESVKTISGGSQPGRDELSDDVELNVSLLPREEGEGSEFAPSPPLPKSYAAGGRRSPLPLERLLEEGIPEDDNANMSVTLGLSVEQELAETKRKLHVQTQRSRHVTSLLSESEREYARACQQNELLKAELRRTSGNIERTAHIHNAEYIKNVTLKFLTLPPGDERVRLVPVLQKILTLSPEETNNLSSVAKGFDSNSNRGWGSYLPWPGGGKA